MLNVFLGSIRRGIVKINTHDGIVQTLMGMMHAPESRRNLILWEFRIPRVASILQQVES